MKSHVALLLAVVALGVSLAAGYEPVYYCCETDYTCIPDIFSDYGYTLPGQRSLLREAKKQCKNSYPAGTPVKDKLCLPDKTSPGECDTPGGCGDPHIKGFDGSNYLLWGKANATYSLVSEARHQINIRLYHPPGRADAHALYIDAVGAMINDARITVTLVPGSPSSMVLNVNGGNVTFPGRRYEGAVDAATSFVFEKADRVVIASRDVTFSVVIVENDHLDIQVAEVAAYWADVHGVMGQTHSKAFKVRYNFAAAKVVGDMPTGKELKTLKKKLALQGKEDDYIVSGLLKADDKFNRFGASARMTSAAPVTRKLLTISELVKTEAGVVGSHAAGKTGGRRLLSDYVTYTCQDYPSY